MTNKNDYITKKDLEEFGNRLEKRIEEKIDQKIEEKIDVKFGENFEIIVSAIVKALDPKLATQQQEIDKQTYEVGVHDSHLTLIEHQLQTHSRKIGNIEKKVFGAVSA